MTTTNHQLPPEIEEALLDLYRDVTPHDLATIPDLLRAVVEGDTFTDSDDVPAEVALRVLRGSLLVLARVIEERLTEAAEEMARHYEERILVPVGTFSAPARAGDPAFEELDPAPVEGIRRPRTVEVALPEEGSLWYLFGNKDLRVRVEWANPTLVAYKDARVEALNREQRRTLPPSAFAVQTQPLYTFLAAATPEEESPR